MSYGHTRIFGLILSIIMCYFETIISHILLGEEIEMPWTCFVIGSQNMGKKIYAKLTHNNLNL